MNRTNYGLFGMGNCFLDDWEGCGRGGGGEEEDG